MPQFPSQQSASGIWTLKKQKRAQQGSNWPLRTLGDFLWNYVTALFKTNSTNGAQNNTFLDSSTNNFSITRNGNTTQGTFSPYGSNWSHYFDGNGDYLSVASNAAFGYGTSDFTIECWFNIDSIPGGSNGYFIIDQRTTGSQAAICAYVYADSTLVLVLNGAVVITGGRVTPRQWNHFALARSGTTTKMFLNGVQVGSNYTDTNNYASLPVLIGARFQFDAGQFFPGYISNFRILKGTALYTTTFTPPATPLTAITNTSLLTCQSNRFRDNSTNNFTITLNGDVSVQRFSPFGSTDSYSATTLGGSAYFDGTGDSLVIQSGNVAQFGTGDFTMEAWVYLLSHDGDESAVMTGGINFGIYTQPNVNIATNGTVNLNGTQSTSNTVPLNTWTHIAVSRNSGTSRIFINGVQGSSASNTSNYNGVGAMIGIRSNGSSDFGTIHGYISNVRYVNGTGLYTSTFTPNTAPLVAISGTSLLLNFTNGGIFDGAVMNDFETVGNAQVSTTQAKYGTTSMYFDGTGDYLTTYATPQFAFGTGNFTIECWVYFNSLTQYDCIIDFRPSGTNGAYPCIFVDTSNTLVYYVGGGNRITSSAVSTGQWYHLAISRAGTDTKMFLNGAQTGSTYSDSNNYLVGNPLTIGGLGYNSPGTYALDGYLDDLRITKGYARYWYPFTPPIATLPDFYEPEVIPANDPLFDYTTLLLSGNGTNGAQNNTFLDSSTNNFTITRNGNTTQGTFTPYGSNWSNYFDGSGDYLSIATNAAFSFGTGDFTISTWIYTGVDSISPAGYSRSIFTLGNITGYLRISAYHGGTTGAFRAYVGASTICDGSTVKLSDNTWHHIAIVRESGNVRHWIDGVYVGTVAYSTNMSNTITNGIGADMNGPDANWNGYIGPTLVVKGTALYTGTSNITVPTTPPTAVSGTSLLTCQSNRFIDSSSNNFAITRNGDVSVQRFSPFNPTTPYAAGTIGGSGYWDGTGDYLTVADNIALDMESSDFTIEGWIFPVVSSGGSVGIFSKRASGAVVGGVLLYYNGAGLTPSLLIGSGGSWVINQASSIAFTLGQWNHFAVVRNGTSFVLYINGAAGVSATSSSSVTDNSAAFALGAWAADGTGIISASYFSNFRVVKGTAVYTSAFTPPTAPLTAITNTSLLLNMTNGGIIDNAMMNDLETVGNAQISTSVSKFGGGSLAFDGSGDALALPANINLAMGSGDFTIEMWVNGANNGSIVGGSYPRLFTLGTEQTSGCIECYNAAGTMYIEIFGVSSLTFSASTLLNSTWNHYAITRSGTSLRAFVNGTQVGTTVTNSTNLNRAATTQSWIGAISASAGNFNGYIDDFRITRGIARYVQNFTPPTQAFQTS